jgi:hypothetical protein
MQAASVCDRRKAVLRTFTQGSTSPFAKVVFRLLATPFDLASQNPGSNANEQFALLLLAEPSVFTLQKLLLLL